MSVIWAVIPQDKKALVTNKYGRQHIVEGPARVCVWSGKKVEIFQRIVVQDGQRGVLFDHEGNYEEIIGPKVVHIDPRGGSWKAHERIDLGPNEAVVVLDSEESSGKARKIIKGSDEPVVFLAPWQKLQEFVWTGGREGGEEKVPRALKFNTLRLNDTQAYLFFKVRTSDNVELTVRLMIYYGYGDIETLIDRDDPLGAMYNKIVATIVQFIGSINFDEFKEKTGEKIGKHPLFTSGSEDEGLGYFSKIGINIQQVVVRGWEPLDQSVQRVLSQAATIQTNKALDEATHQQNMARIKNELKELEEGKKLEEVQRGQAEAAGKKRAAELSAIFDGLSEKVGKPAARQLLLLEVAKGAGQLVVSPEMLTAANRE